MVIRQLSVTVGEKRGLNEEHCFVTSVMVVEECGFLGFFDL